MPFCFFKCSLFFQTAHIGIYCTLIHVGPNSSCLVVSESYKGNFHDYCLSSQPTSNAEQLHQYSPAACLHLKRILHVFFNSTTCSESMICLFDFISLFFFFFLLPTSSLDHNSALVCGGTVEHDLGLDGLTFCYFTLCAPTFLHLVDGSL